MRRYEKPPQVYFYILSTVFSVRKYFLRYFVPPRPEIFRRKAVSATQSKEGTYDFYIYEAAPFYVKPTFYNRWVSPGAWIYRLLALPVPGDGGDSYLPGGYRIANLGPSAFEGKGKQQMDVTKERLQKQRTGGCPFAI